MRPTLFLFHLLALAPFQVLAFPKHMAEAFRSIPRATGNGDTREVASESAFVKRQAPGITPPFDAKKQYVSTTGKHAFVPPSRSDKRGPCKHSSKIMWEPSSVDVI